MSQADLGNLTSLEVKVEPSVAKLLIVPKGSAGEATSDRRIFDEILRTKVSRP